MLWHETARSLYQTAMTLSVVTTEYSYCLKASLKSILRRICLPDRYQIKLFIKQQRQKIRLCCFIYQCQNGKVSYATVLMGQTDRYSDTAFTVVLNGQLSAMILNNSLAYEQSHSCRRHPVCLIKQMSRRKGKKRSRTSPSPKKFISAPV